MERAATDPLKISVVIPTYRRYDPLLHTLDCLISQDYPNFEIIVADQNQRWPETYSEKLEKYKHSGLIFWLYLSEPGVVKARNQSVLKSTGDLLVFVDDDVEIRDPHFLAKHAINYIDNDIMAVSARELTFTQHREVIEALTAKLSVPRKNILSPPAPKEDWRRMPPYEQACWFPRHSDVRTWVGTLCTCNMSIGRSTFIEAGGLDEQFIGNAYGDDHDLAIRLTKLRACIVYDPEPWLIHLKSPIGGLRLNDVANPSTEFEKVYSLVLFYLRHGRNAGKLRTFYTGILRPTILRRPNVLKPWKQPRVWLALLKAFRAGKRISDSGPVSPFV